MHPPLALRSTPGSRPHPARAVAALAFVAALAAAGPARADPDDGGSVDELITDLALGMMGGIGYFGLTGGSIVVTGINLTNVARGTPDGWMEIPGYALGGLGVVSGALMIAYPPEDCHAECRDFFVIGGGVALGIGVATLIATLVTTAVRLGDERPADDPALPLDLGVMAGPETAGFSFAIPW